MYVYLLYNTIYLCSTVWEDKEIDIQKNGTKEIIILKYEKKNLKEIQILLKLIFLKDII